MARIIEYVVLLIVCVGVTIGVHLAYDTFINKTHIMTSAKVKSAVDVAKALNVPQTQAKQIIERIDQTVQKKPAQEYSVQATSTIQAAAIVKKQIDTKTIPIKLSPADKTIVIPQATKVDVYRVNMQRTLGIGAYATNLSAGAFIRVKRMYVMVGDEYRTRKLEVGVAYELWSH